MIKKFNEFMNESHSNVSNNKKGYKPKNKKELEKLETSKNLQKVREKYRNEKIIDYLRSMIATIITSDFAIISYEDPKIDNRVIDCNKVSDIIMEEMLLYALLI